MFFQPRIFISSLLRDKLEIRKRIETLFKQCGATVLLYEKNLTPSINKYTYRKDVLDADFIIVILDEEYGSATPSGLSGTEEEYRIATENKQNVHVYIREIGEDKLDEKQREFLTKIKKSGVSYYLYKDDADLLSRIRKSIMSISKDIVISKLNDKNVDPKLITKISFNHDYEYAIGLSAIYQTFNRILNEDGIDYLYSDIVLAFFDNLFCWVKANPFLFNDIKMYDLCLDALSTGKEWIHRHALEFVSNRIIREYNVPKLGKIEIWQCTTNNKNIDVDWYKNQFKQFANRFDEFISYIKDRKASFDTYMVD